MFLAGTLAIALKWRRDYGNQGLIMNHLPATCYVTCWIGDIILCSGVGDIILCSGVRDKILHSATKWLGEYKQHMLGRKNQKHFSLFWLSWHDGEAITFHLHWKRRTLPRATCQEVKGQLAAVQLEDGRSGITQILKKEENEEDLSLPHSLCKCLCVSLS